jgi:GDP-L-fucose synthase
MSIPVLITGATGMLGTALSKLLPGAICVNSKDCDLTDSKVTEQLFFDYKPSQVFHLAGKVGGVLSNKRYIADFYHKNIMINTNVLEACRKSQVYKLVSCLSTCIYPDKVEYPLVESNIHSGEPHSSNYGYAFAKRMLDIQSRAYREQYNCNFVTIVPNNMFGEHDNFHLEDSHVIPAMIRKIWEAKLKNQTVELWGDGTPLREFTYSKDIARAMICVMEKYNSPQPINVGNVEEIQIKYLAEKISENLGYSRAIIWNKDMPTGQHRKPSNNEVFMNLDNFQYSDFEKSLKSVCEWFVDTYPNVRGI